MAAGDYTPNRSGQIEGSGSNTALFLKLFSGEVLTAFQQQNYMNNCHLVKTGVRGRKSEQFPVLGRTSADYHTPGALLAGQSILANERTISLDNIMVSSVSIANIDEIMAHYETRSAYVSEMASALANKMNLYQTVTLIQAARTNRTMATGVASAGAAGITPPDAIYSSGADTTEATLRAALFTAAQRADAQFLPLNGRYVQLKPAQWYLLVNTFQGFLNRDIGGAGSWSTTDLPTVATWVPIKNLSYPTWKARVTASGAFQQPALANNTYGPADVTAATSLYGYDKSVAVCHHMSAIGTLRAEGISTESEYSVSRQASIVVGKYVAGHGILRPEAAIEIATGESGLS
jgi:hypothetical protein